MPSGRDDAGTLDRPVEGLIAPPDRPVARFLDLIFWSWTFLLLGLCAAGFVAIHLFGWQAFLAGGIDYWFYFSVLLGPLILATRHRVGRFLAQVPLPRVATFALAALTVSGVEEFVCYRTGAGLWEPQPRLPLFPAWIFGTLVLVGWALWTLVMMHVFGLAPKAALYVGGLAGWIQESFLFVPRFWQAPLLLPALDPLIAFTYMQLIFWPMELFPRSPRPRLAWKNPLARYAGALVGILVLEEATVIPLYFLLMRSYGNSRPPRRQTNRTDEGGIDGVEGWIEAGAFCESRGSAEQSSRAGPDGRVAVLLHGIHAFRLRRDPGSGDRHAPFSARKL